MTTEKTENLPLLKNDKPHVSYSEVSTWTSCSYKHKLVYIDKLTSTDISPYLDYGTIIHDAAEKFIKTRKLEIEVAQEKIEKAWKEHIARRVGMSKTNPSAIGIRFFIRHGSSSTEK